MTKCNTVFLVVVMAAFALICAALLTGCSDCLNQRELERYLKVQIPIGARREEVERALAVTGLDWTYTDFLKRYNTTVRDPDRCGQWVALSVYVHLDKGGRFQQVEIFRSYTMP